MPGNYFDRSEL
ncbi:unnamed protein product, partial [Allacma fusca]